MVNMHLSISVTVLLSIAIGLVIGFLNGFVVTYCKIPSIIAALGTSWVFKGLKFTPSATPSPYMDFRKDSQNWDRVQRAYSPSQSCFIICVLITTFVNEQDGIRKDLICGRLLTKRRQAFRNQCELL